MYDLTKILPHKPPMILLDDILEMDIKNGTLTAVFKVNQQKIFYEAGKGINTLTGIEFMAQAIGCYAYFKITAKSQNPDYCWVQGCIITKFLILKRMKNIKSL